MQLRPGIGAIGEQVAQPWAGMAYGFQHGRRAVAVLGIGCMDDETEEHAGGIDDSMALATFDLLSSVIAANPAMHGDQRSVDIGVTQASGLQHY